MSDEESRPVLYVSPNIDCLIWQFISWIRESPPSRLKDAVLSAGVKCGDGDVVWVVGWREEQEGRLVDNFGDICGDGERLWEC